MKAYIIRTHADKEFDHSYSRASVIDSHYEDDGETLVIETEVEDWYASAYERMLDTDSAVISYREAK